jgi:glycosyltransferase involved in cell wall biosynthesis
MSSRIMHVLPGQHVGGAEQVGLNLAQSQISRGHDVRMFLGAAGQVSEAAIKMGIPFSIVKATLDSAGGKSARHRAFADGLTNAAVEFHPEIVHSHVPITHLICGRVLPGMRIPWVATIHGSWKQFSYAAQTISRPWLRPYLLVRHALGDLIATRSAAKLVAVSEYTMRGLAAVGVDRRKISVIHNGLPPLTNPAPPEVAREQMGIRGDAVLIGSLGYFAPVKGFDLLIKAFAEVKDRFPQAMLRIAGGGVMGETQARTSLERLITERGLSDRARLLDPVDPRGGFLSALDIYVVSSRTEGFPLSLVEAMWHGKPSVVSSEGGSVEAARPGQESLVFESGNLGALASSLARLISEGELRRKLGEAASARASTYLTLQRCTDEYEATYAEVMARSRRSS